MLLFLGENRQKKKRKNELYCFRKREELIFEPFLTLFPPFLLLEVNEAGFYCSAAPANALMKSSVPLATS